jgi:NitT/TauT family transport system substrate-binding protein
MSVFFIYGCGNHNESKLRISLNSWIGYSPVYYVKEKGWMDGEIEFHSVVSLEESVKMFQAGITDGFCGTQYEYRHSNLLKESTVPVILIEVSKGGDVVLSNFDITDKDNLHGRIDVYLELQTINSIIFQRFVEMYDMGDCELNLINMNQFNISKLQPASDKLIVVTYEPYSTGLIKKGFIQAADSESLNMLVVDGIFLKTEKYAERKALLKKLRQNMNKALDVLKNDPMEYYITVLPYLDGLTYDEFLESLNDIEWVSGEMSDNLKKGLDMIDIPYDKVLR